MQWLGANFHMNQQGNRAPAASRCFLNMKNHATTQSTTATTPRSNNAHPVKKPPSNELGITERRRSVRPLPVPLVVERQSDSVWAEFQALLAKKSNP